jgi:hypothetical protein
MAAGATLAPGAGDRTLTYNGPGQMTRAQDVATDTSYAYAGSGQNELITRTVAGGDTTKYVYGRPSKYGVPMVDVMTVNGANHHLDNGPDGSPWPWSCPPAAPGTSSSTASAPSSPSSTARATSRPPTPTAPTANPWAPPVPARWRTPTPTATTRACSTAPPATSSTAPAGTTPTPAGGPPSTPSPASPTPTAPMHTRLLGATR